MVKKNVITWSYVRCSTTKQDLSTQSQQLIDYSNAYGFSIDNQISDFGISGSEFNREGLNQIKEGMKNQSFNQLLIYSISRLGRSMVETITFLNELNEIGINVISLKENIDLSTPSGKMISSILSVLSEYELETLRNRVSDTLQTKKRNGIKYTKSVYGFDFDNLKMSLNEKEQKLIRKIFRMYNNGFGYTEISNHLNTNGHRIKNGRLFSRFYVRNILQNKHKITDKNHQFYNGRTPIFV